MAFGGGGGGALEQEERSSEKGDAIVRERRSYVPKCLQVSGLYDSHIIGALFFNQPLFLKRQIHCLPSSSI